MNEQITVKVEDFTQNRSNSNLAAVIYYHPLQRQVEVYKDGQVRLISTAGTVNAHFLEDEKRDVLRQHYIQMLLENGVKGEELEQALTAIARVDQRLSEEMDSSSPVSELEQKTQIQLRDWAEARGIDYDTLTEDEWFEQVDQGIKKVRERGRS